MNCIYCGEALLPPVVMTVLIGGPQVCGPCIDRINRDRQKLQENADAINESLPVKYDKGVSS